MESPSHNVEEQKYFMAMALLAASRSPDPHRKVGACIVGVDKQIIGIGYNRHPYGCEKFSWDKKEKHLFVCHAELNAFLNKNSLDLKNCSIYTTRFPCNECAKIIIHSRIKEVYYLIGCNEDDPFDKASNKMLKASKVNTWEIDSSESITIDFKDYLPRK